MKTQLGRQGLVFVQHYYITFPPEDPIQHASDMPASEESNPSVCLEENPERRDNSFPHLIIAMRSQLGQIEEN